MLSASSHQSPSWNILIVFQEHIDTFHLFSVAYRHFAYATTLKEK
jgi:hypothetical protein